MRKTVSRSAATIRAVSSCWSGRFPPCCVALAGALYVPQVGIINPGEMSPTNSIEAAIWVALGGRGTLVGPVIGAALVNGAKSFFTVAMPEYWQLFLGLIFIAVTLFLPRGVFGLFRKGEN